MDSNSESVWYGAPPAPETISAPEPKHEDERHVRLRTDARYFLLLSLALGAVFALLFVNAYALGLNAALLAAAEKTSGKTFLFWNTLNSRPSPDGLETIDYRTLPTGFHSYFETPVQPLDR